MAGRKVKNRDNDIIIPDKYSKTKPLFIETEDSPEVCSCYDNNYTGTPFAILNDEVVSKSDILCTGTGDIDKEIIREFLLECGKVYFGRASNVKEEWKEQIEVIIEALRHWDLKGSRILLHDTIMFKTESNFLSFFGIDRSIVTSWCSTYDSFGTEYRQQLLSCCKAKLDYCTSGNRVNSEYKIETTIINRLVKEIEQLELQNTAKFNLLSFYEILKDKMSNPNILALTELKVLMVECIAKRLTDHKTGIENWQLNAEGQRVIDKDNRILKIVNIENGEEIFPENTVFVLRDEELLKDCLYQIASEIQQKFIEIAITDGTILKIADTK